MTEETEATEPPARPKRHKLTREEASRGGRARTPKRAAHSRTAAWRNGSRAIAGVKLPEVVKARLRKLDPEAPELIAEFVDAVAAGRLDESTKLFARSLVEHEMLRAKVVEKIAEDGLTTKDLLLDLNGKVYGEKVRAHPLLEFVHKLQASNLATAEALQMTRKSRGEGHRDAAMTRFLERRTLLQEQRHRMLPPASRADDDEPIDVTPLPEEGVRVGGEK